MCLLHKLKILQGRQEEWKYLNSNEIVKPISISMHMNRELISVHQPLTTDHSLLPSTHCNPEPDIGIGGEKVSKFDFQTEVEGLL